MGDKPIKVQEFRGVGEIDEPYCIAHIGGCTHCLTEEEASKLHLALEFALHDLDKKFYAAEEDAVQEISGSEPIPPVLSAPTMEEDIAHVGAVYAAPHVRIAEDKPTEEELDAKYGEGVRPKYGALFTKKS